MKFSPHHAKLITILLLYLALATTHSLIVPLTVGNDEWAHFRYIRFIAEHGRLPLNWTERDEAGYKADAPPLYHLIVAAVTSPISPTRTLRLLDTPRSQLADNQLATDALLYTTAQAWPYRGEVLMWHIGRGVSIFFGLTLIIITYLTALQVGLRRRQARAATAFIAFTPAIIFHSSVLSYESLSATLTALLLLIALKLLRPLSLTPPLSQRERGDFRLPLPLGEGRGEGKLWFSLGVLAGLAIITKYSALLLPLELLFILFSYYKVSNLIIANTNFSPLISHLSLMALGLLFAVSGWLGFILYNFNTVATDGLIVGLINPIFVGDASDTTSVQVASLLFNSAPSDTRPPKPRDYLALTQAFLNSFWSAPIMGEYLPYLPLIFTAFIIILGIRNWELETRNFKFQIPNSQFLILLFHTFLITPLLLIRVLFSYDALEVAQGRHLLMPAASAIAILIQLGITNYELRTKNSTPYSLLIIHYSLFTWSALGQVGLAIIAYPPPLTVESTPAQANPLAILTPALQLNQAKWETKGNNLAVTLEWHALATMTQDYLIDLQLHNSKGQLVTQMIGQPVYGRYPTRAWEIGDTVTDVYQIPLSGFFLGFLQGDYTLTLHLLQRDGQPVPDTMPITLGQVALNSYNRQTFICEPIYTHAQPLWRGLGNLAYRPYATITIFSPEPPYLLASDGRRQIPLISNDNWHTFMVEPNWYQSYHLMIGDTDCRLIHFDIPPRPFTPPPIAHPLAVNFNNEVELIGYDLPTRRIAAGQRLPLTLYWRSLAYMGQDYQIFDNLLDANQQRWGGYDRRPRDGYSTLLWVPGEIITDTFGVPIDPAAPNGIYTLDVGLYQITPQGAASLPIINNEQKSIRLGPIKVGGAPTYPPIFPPESGGTEGGSPESGGTERGKISLNQSFADSITLLGYDLKQNNTTLQLTLYWQATNRPNADYTTFVHLRDAMNHNAAQQDGPPGQGRYPTSLWDKGDIVAQPVTLSLNNITPGRYHLVIGLYDSVTGNRLPFADSPQNELSLGEIIK